MLDTTGLHEVAFYLLHPKDTFRVCEGLAPREAKYVEYEVLTTRQYNMLKKAWAGGEVRAKRVKGVGWRYENV